MNNLKHLCYAGVVGAALAFAPTGDTPSADAMPNTLTKSLAGTNYNGDILPVRDRYWRRRHWRRHHHHYDDDFNSGAYIALGLIGALIDRGVSESYARSAMERCNDRFRSFEWDTGLYTTYGGDKRLCPYLR